MHSERAGVNTNQTVRHREKMRKEGTMVPLLLFMLLLLSARATASAPSLQPSLSVGVTTSVSSSLPSSLPGCPSRCGTVEVPYPFGTSDGCARDESFVLACNGTYDPPRPYFGDFEITEISLLHGFARTSLFLVADCYTRNGTSLNPFSRSSNLGRSAFTISAEHNVFAVTGCDTYAYLNNDDDDSDYTGCDTGCRKLDSVTNGTCNGFGCCQTGIPKGLKAINIEVWSLHNHTRIWSFNPCGYAFVIEAASFDFNTSLIKANYYDQDVEMPAVLDWAIEGSNCTVAKETTTTYGCRSANSECVEAFNKRGYLCNCSQGFEGNPYLVDGCRDIDECQDRQNYPCHGVCSNFPGGYNCTCKPGDASDDPKRIQCIKRFTGQKFPLWLKLVTGLGCLITLLLALSSWSYFLIQKKKEAQQRQDFFFRNGGFFLQQQITSNQTNAFKIFSMAEMERATNNFDQNNVLGRGGHGTVYKGILDDQRVVAIKKAMIIDESKNKEFAKEIGILSQINHKNVVKIMGCCLEVEIPLLVYEYIPKGTLFHYIHEIRRPELLIPFSIRLRIATETAEALCYLHSAASPPILHGDVKSSNILLDESYTAKVSDFGTSTFAPNDKAQFTTIVQGTCGYLDPEYLQTCQLTEKSDVYSFGVVLVELLTGKMALCFEGSEEERSTTIRFISFLNSGRLLQILDPQIANNGLSKSLLDVSNLATQCLRLIGAERPTMKEVLRELETVERSRGHSWAERDAEERESLLGRSPRCYSHGDASAFVFPSIETHGVLNIDNGR